MRKKTEGGLAMVDVLVLAGGTLPDDLKEYSSGFDNRALLKIGDRYMIEYVIDALSESKNTGKIMVVGMKEPLEKAIGSKVEKVEEAAETMMENLQIGVKYFANSRKLLLATCDTPLLDGAMVDRFLEGCNNERADIYYTLIEKKLNEKKYPATKRTYFQLREGIFTGGNLVLLDPKGLKDNWPLIEKAIAARKSPMKLLSMIGIGFIVAYLLKRLSIGMIENKIFNITGLAGKAVRVIDPEIGIDVDKESDYLLVKKCLENT